MKKKIIKIINKNNYMKANFPNTKTKIFNKNKNL